MIASSPTLQLLRFLPAAACSGLLLALLTGCGGSGGGSNATEPPSPPAASKDAALPEPTAPWFEEVTDRTGIDFRFFTGATGRLFLPEITAGGVAVFDADRNGLPDIYALNGSATLPDVTLSDDPDAPVNRFFGNLGSFRFEDRTETSGLGCPGYAFGVAIGDIDDDGHPDVFLTNLGPDRLFRNRGDGTFEEITAESALDTEGWGTSAVLFDFNRSGQLDLAIARYVEFLPKRCTAQSGRPDYCGPREFPPVHDLLFVNTGAGRFEDRSEEAGLTAIRAAGLGIVADDFDDDGWCDLYVANDGYANQLWINREGITMTDLAMRLGSALNMFGQAEAGMGVVAADFNHSGRMDLFMTHLLNESNTLYINHGGRRGFSDSTSTAGLDASSMPYTGFGVVAFDVDDDGELDIFVANGRVYAEAPAAGNLMPEPWSNYAEPNLMYQGLPGARFAVMDASLSGFGIDAEISRGAAAADLDGNGRLDLVVVNVEAPLRIFRNVAPRNGSSLRIRAVEGNPERDALGARVTIEFGDEIRTRTIQTGGGYLTASPPIAHVGLGEITEVDRIRVRWPDGTTEIFPGGPVDQLRTLSRGTGHAPETP